MRIALYEPDIPQNTGALLRLGACMGVPIEIVGQPGFVLSDAKLRRAGMDYIRLADIRRHDDFGALRASVRPPGRVVLLTTHGTTDFRDVAWQPDDILLLGRESAGVPEQVHAEADLRTTIPLAPGCRSLNVALAAAMALTEALRQTRGFPGDAART